MESVILVHSVFLHVAVAGDALQCVHVSFHSCETLSAGSGTRRAYQHHWQAGAVSGNYNFILGAEHRRHDLHL